MPLLSRLADAADFLLLRVLPMLCAILLALMVGFIAYTVVMRTVFLSPPFWGDTLALFANVWLVFLGLVVAVRERTNIAMEALYEVAPESVGKFLRKSWTIVTAALGLLMLWPGYQAASRILGSYWELGGLPKSYPMMILPVAGLGILVAAALVFIRPIDSRGGND